LVEFDSEADNAKKDKKDRKMLETIISLSTVINEVSS
jgi:hypothetical protein